MTDMTDEAVKSLLEGATPGRRVQFHGSYCPEAVGTPFSDWDTSHDVSVIRPDGSRYRLAHYKHASDAYLSQMAPDLARALLDARAQLADAEATQAALRAEIDRLTRWRAEEGEKIKRQAKALTDLTKHCQRIEAENAGLARKIGKVQRGDGDHSQIADLEAKVINQRNELANLRARDGRLAELAAERDRLAAANAVLEAKVAGLVEAVKPFDAVGGTLFSKNWNMSDIVFDGGPMRSDCLFFEDFLNLRAALATQEAGNA